MTTVLLGPQRFRQTAGTVADALAPDGPVATVTAGWRDREKDDAELHEVMGGRARNLHLFTRLGHVVRHDPTFAAAASVYNRSIDEANKLYKVRLSHAMDAVYTILRRTARQDLIDSALRAGVQSVQDIDAWYVWLTAELEDELRSVGQVDSSDVIAGHRGEVAEILDSSALLAIAGGHVSFLMRCLRLFEAFPSPDLPVVGWSAGAMVLTDHIVLYHDKGPAGVQPAEVWDRGLGRVPRVIAMPHARRRLALDDVHRNLVLAHRFAPARVLLLDDGMQVRIGDDGSLPAEARVVTAEGTIATIEDEASASEDCAS
ncbi:MAG: type 1 glutamine amidotransferase-like domain-containing protein [Intrasporangiaceae bacterium]|nr:type 1 glutamine amidotransferase-like domain-containing protein [Intrasporangiaceae bacterium]